MIVPVAKRKILFDVKMRVADFIKQAETIAIDGNISGGTVPAPDHDPKILFKGVEDKFLPADPELYFQGAWIVMDIKQEETELSQAFESIDPAKVHFAIISGWEPGVCVLTRKPEDRAFLLDLFSEAERDLTFKRQAVIG